MKKIIIVFLFCLLIPFSVHARPDNVVVNLRFNPNHGVWVRPNNVPPVKIFFEGIKDARSNPRSIGVNIERRNDRIPVYSGSNDEASRFVHSTLVREFRRKNFSVEDQAAAASRIITATILKFWTEETSVYSSQTQLQIEVKDKNGLIYLSRTYTGFGRNKGRSLHDVNYDQCISDSVASLINKLFSDQEFLSALSGRSFPSAIKK